MEGCTVQPPVFIIKTHYSYGERVVETGSDTKGLWKIWKSCQKFRGNHVSDIVFHHELKIIAASKQLLGTQPRKVTPNLNTLYFSAVAKYYYSTFFSIIQ